MRRANRLDRLNSRLVLRLARLCQLAVEIFIDDVFNRGTGVFGNE
jgi:hypothetical protein